MGDEMSSDRGACDGRRAARLGKIVAKTQDQGMRVIVVDVSPDVMPLVAFTPPISPDELLRAAACLLRTAAAGLQACECCASHGVEIAQLTRMADELRAFPSGPGWAGRLH